MKNLNQKNLNKIKKIISILLLIIWCLLIFYFSNQTGIISENSSSQFLNFINKILNVNLYNFKYSILLVRKLAHMFLYFVLYFLALNVFKKFNWKNKYLISLLFCLFYAISDEVHQLFIDERSPQLIDILIDITGAFISLLIIKISIYFKNKKRYI